MQTTPDRVVHLNVICPKYTHMETKFAIKLNLMISNSFFLVSSYFENFKVRSQQPKNIACAIISLYVGTMLIRKRLLDICAGRE